MKSKTITALKVEPMKVPAVVKLNNNLDSLQKAVSEGCESQGLIEIIPIADGAAILCNEEGKLLGLEGNRRLGNDILVGTFYVVGDTKQGNLCSLNEKQIAFYHALFKDPEVFTDEEIADSLFFEITDAWKDECYGT